MIAAGWWIGTLANTKLSSMPARTAISTGARATRAKCVLPTSCITVTGRQLFS
jgi:hypothetical protein